jgi:hypothetical protein
VFAGIVAFDRSLPTAALAWCSTAFFAYQGRAKVRAHSRTSVREVASVFPDAGFRHENITLAAEGEGSQFKGNASRH